MKEAMGITVNADSQPRVVIVGATGFIASALSQYLAAAGYLVIGLSRRNQSSAGAFTDWFQVDYRNRHELRRIYELVQPQIVIHATGITDQQSLVSTIRAESQLVRSTLDAISQSRTISKFVYLSSSAVYDSSPPPFNEDQSLEPKSHYGISKYLAEQEILKSCEFAPYTVLVLRPSVVFGSKQPKGMFAREIFDAFSEGRILMATSGKQTRDFIDIEDFSRVLVELLALEVPRELRTLNIGSGQSLTLREFAAKFAETKSVDISRVVNFGVIPDRANEIYDYRLDLSRLNLLLGAFKFKSIKESLISIGKEIQNHE